MIYKKSARRYWLHYVLVAGGLLFIASALMIQPEIHCQQSECPTWLQVGACIMGAVLMLSGFVAILYNWQWGSKVDLEKGSLFWWESFPPIKEKEIPLREISCIRIEQDLDSPRITLLDKNLLTLPFSSQCVPYPYVEWAEELKKIAPHIKIEIKD